MFTKQLLVLAVTNTLNLQTTSWSSSLEMLYVVANLRPTNKFYEVTKIQDWGRSSHTLPIKINYYSRVPPICKKEHLSRLYRTKKVFMEQCYLQ